MRWFGLINILQLVAEEQWISLEQSNNEKAKFHQPIRMLVIVLASRATSQ